MSRAIYYPGMVPHSEPGALRALYRARHLRCLISCAGYGFDRVSDKVCELEESGIHVIVDSGIYTLLYGPAKRAVSTSDCERYFERWLRTVEGIEATTKRVTFVEWDAQAVVGLPRVREYREAAQAVAGDRLMYVWHRADGADALRELAGKYVAITLVGDGGSAEYRAQTAYLSAKALRMLGARIHLLGVSSLGTLHRLNGLFDTFDSSSWCAGNRFGSAETAAPMERYLVYSKKHVLSHEYLLLKELRRLQEFVITEENPWQNSPTN